MRVHTAQATKYEGEAPDSVRGGPGLIKSVELTEVENEVKRTTSG